MNVSLIGMPSSGKSSVGVILAKLLEFDFLDTDILIQKKSGMSLQKVVDEMGYLKLREIEEEVVLSLDVDRYVIATGGSVVYSESAMRHLKSISTIVYLKITYPEMIKRLGDYTDRGLAKPKEQSILELYRERAELYEKYADFTIFNEGVSASEAASMIAEVLKG